MKRLDIQIRTPFIRLCDLLKYSSVCVSGGEAKVVILCGKVTVNGVVCEQKGRKIVPGDVVSYSDHEIIVSIYEE